MFDIEGEDTGGVKSDVERFVLDYKDGNLYRMCKEEGSSQSVTTLAPTTTTTTGGTSPMANTELTTVTIMMETNVTTLAPTTTPLVPTTTPSLVTVGPNELTNEINSSDVNENVRFRAHCGKNDLRKGYVLLLWKDHFLDWAC